MRVTSSAKNTSTGFFPSLWPGLYLKPTHTHTVCVCRPIPVQSLRRKHSLLQSKAKQCSSSLSFSTQDSPRYQMNNSCMLGCYHRGRPLTEIPQRVSTFPGVVPALAAQAIYYFKSACALGVPCSRNVAAAHKK